MQGFNMGRYYPPPEDDASPSFNKSHPLGQRARKLRSEGILTVRFEMPFAIWCGTCPKPTIIGQGVRFNAEKKKVGNYHSTPIWQFRMKHTACGGWIEIRTDPKATEYVVTEGAKRRDYGDERREDEIGVLDPEARDRQREDAMAGLEGKKDEEKVKKESGRRINELLQESDKWWQDPYEASRFVRRGFRQDRKLRAQENQKVEQIKERMGLDIELLPESELDKQRAGLVEFGDWSGQGAEAAVAKPLFAAKQDISTQVQLSTRSATAKAASKQSFEDKLRQNTRAAIDPFMTQTKSDSPARVAISGIRKTAASGEASDTRKARTSAPVQLVQYDSD